MSDSLTVSEFDASVLQLLVDLYGFSVTDLSCYPVTARAPYGTAVTVWGSGMWSVSMTMTMTLPPENRLMFASERAHTPLSAASMVAWAALRGEHVDD